MPFSFFDIDCSTAIHDTTVPSLQHAAEQAYDLTGRPATGIQKGIRIVKSNDGGVRKVLVP